jgi:hypothetical protein
VRRSLIIVVAGALSVAACNQSSGRDSDEGYCSKLIDQQELLIAPMETREDIAASIGRYRAFAESAPLDVDEQWKQLADVLDQAATVDLADPEAKQEVIDAAFASEQSARAIADHASATCQLDTLKLIIPPAPGAGAPVG